MMNEAIGVLFLFYALKASLGQEEILQNGSTEYCQPGEFSVSCGPQDVLLITSAQYGRMRLGKCVKKDYGSIGCAADVLPEMDRKCSGRHECSFDVDSFHGKQPCPDDLTPYLEASYECIQVIQAEDRLCTPGEPIRVSEPEGIIANIVTEQMDYGSEDCPWLIQAKEGQKINVTLVNFARTPNIADNNIEDVQQRPRICYQYATIREQGVTRTITECVYNPRETKAYLSATHQLEIAVHNRKTADIYFLLKYEVVGCADPTLPRGSWKKRVGDSLMVKCNLTDEQWTITCNGQRWSGTLGNCSKVEEEGKNSGSFFPGGDDFPYGILIVVAIGVALGVFFGGILLTCASLHMKRKRRETEAEEELNRERIYNFPQGDKRLHPSQFPYDPRGPGSPGVGETTLEPKEFTYPDPNFQQYGSYIPTEHPQGFRAPGQSGHIYESPKFGRKAFIQHIHQ